VALNIEIVQSELQQMIDKFLELLQVTEARHWSRFFRGGASKVREINSIYSRLRNSINSSCEEAIDSDELIDLLDEHMKTATDELCSLYGVTERSKGVPGSVWVTISLMENKIDDYFNSYQQPITIIY
jgi:hypothetical protein